MLDVRNVYKTFNPGTVNEKTALNGVSLHLNEGDFVTVIGGNGAGKSTLLKAILGELPHTGNVQFSGHGGETPAKLRIGYVPQTLSVDAGSPATVSDMILSLTTRYPVFLPRRRRTAERLRAHLSRFNVAGLMDKPVGRLSGGELQRVLLAAATMPAPDLLVLDEPVSGVDRAGLRLFYDILDGLKSSSDMVMLLVSHDLEYVRTHADRVVLLDRGVEACGTPSEVFASEAFRRAFPETAAGKGGASHA